MREKEKRVRKYPDQEHLANISKHADHLAYEEHKGVEETNLDVA